jgi:hypothetical protein
VHLEGWLMKKVPSRKLWRRRYFVIIKDRCWYFEMAPKVRAAVPLPSPRRERGLADRRHVAQGQIDLRGGVSAHSTKTIQPTEASHEHFSGVTSRTRFAYRCARRAFVVAGGAHRRPRHRPPQVHGQRQQPRVQGRRRLAGGPGQVAAGHQPRRARARRREEDGCDPRGVQGRHL